MSKQVIASKEKRSITPLWLLVLMMIFALFFLIKGCAHSDTQSLDNARVSFARNHQADIDAHRQASQQYQSKLDKLQATIVRLQTELQNSQVDLQLANSLTAELTDKLEQSNIEYEELIKVWRECAQELSFLQQNKE